MSASIPLAAVAVGLGAVASLAASFVLVTRLERLGARLGLTEAILGLVAALGADSPEISSAVAALARGQQDVGVGVVLGSNVFNLAALLGFGAVVAGRITLHRKVVLLEGVVGLWMAALSIGAVGGWIGPGLGLALALAVLGPYVYVSAVHPNGRRRLPLPPRWRKWLAGAVAEEERELIAALPPRKAGRNDAWVAAAALLIVVAASVAMVRGASSLGARYGVPAIVVGGVLLAALTSLPNVVAAVYLARRGRGSATLSEAMNSNTVNVVVGLLIPGAILSGFGALSREAVLIAAWYAVLTFSTLALSLRRRGLLRHEGFLLIGLHLAFVAVLASR